MLPAWFLEALEGDPTDTLPNKRSETRHEWVSLGGIERMDSSERKNPTVKIFNVSTGGLGFISRQPLELGERVRIAPEGLSEDGTPFDPIEATVTYCTQTIQGYKVGCSLP
jgi:hypothetical protein